MNQLDSELVVGALVRSGYGLAERLEEADVALFNTCSVREHAEDRVISRVGMLKRLKRQRPGMLIGILGCMAQKEGDRLLERLPFVGLVVGPQQYPSIVRHVEEALLASQPLVVTDRLEEGFLEAYRSPLGRRRRFQAYVKAMEGCDMKCTFCVVPFTRGPEKSRPVAEIVEEVRRLAAEGTKEITLLGQTINSYGKGLSPRIDLAGLLEALDPIQGIERIRFLTSHPVFVTDRLIRAMAQLPKVCEYLHVPAQSGSNLILKAMRRGYTAERYLAIVEKIRSADPSIEIAGDFIVGFPGETDEDFEETVRLAERVRFQNSFIFRYSARRGTYGFDHQTDDVPEASKKERQQALLGLQARHSLERHRRLIGTTVEVLVEGPSRKDPRRYTGRTRSGQIVAFPSRPENGTLVGDERAGELVRIRISEVTPLTLIGDPVEEPAQ